MITLNSELHGLIKYLTEKAHHAQHLYSYSFVDKIDIARAYIKDNAEYWKKELEGEVHERMEVSQIIALYSDDRCGRSAAIDKQAKITWSLIEKEIIECEENIFNSREIELQEEKQFNTLRVLSGGGFWK